MYFYKNRDLFSIKSNENTFFIRTFVDNLNQDKVNEETGYEATTAGFLMGNENNLTDEIQQGWALGLSSSDTDFDNSFGKSDSETFHGMIYQNQKFNDYTLGINLGTFITRTDMKREITEGSVQSLKSRANNFGFDVTGDIKQSYDINNSFILSFETGIRYSLTYNIDGSNPIGQFENDIQVKHGELYINDWYCLLYTSPSPRDVEESRMPASA